VAIGHQISRDACRFADFSGVSALDKGPIARETMYGRKRVSLVFMEVSRFYAIGGTVILEKGSPSIMPVKKVAKGATAPAVTLKHLAAKLAEEHSVPKKQAETILGDLVGLVVKHLKKGDRIRIGGLGILQVRKRAARLGRNPATGETIKIKASKKVAFRAAKELKEAI
jgi:DNA-binding protein HU-beta